VQVPTPTPGREGSGAIRGKTMFTHTILAVRVPLNTWFVTGHFAFIKRGYFPFAFNKNQCWFLTHRLKTASLLQRPRSAVAQAGTVLR
jgi:hypothetical protein